MHDLRRRALESNKTLSRKAQSKQASPAVSKPASASVSRAASRAASRAGSDDEDNGGGHLSGEASFRYAISPFASAANTSLMIHASVGSVRVFWPFVAYSIFFP